MTRLIRVAAAIIAVAFVSVMLGCGGGATPTTVYPIVTPSTPAAPQTVVQPITVVVTPSGRQLGASETLQFTAGVSNTTDTAVKWSLLCPAQECGTISTGGLYTAPSFVAGAAPVTITATLNADSSKSGSASLLLMPVTISIAPNVPANLLPGATRSFTATLRYDAQNAGVSWALSGAGCSGDSCGTLSNVTSASALYGAPATAPNPPGVTLTATSLTDANQKTSVTFTVSAGSLNLGGDYAFLVNGYVNGYFEAMAGHFTAHADGTLSGALDVNRGVTADVAQPITGSYSMQPDGHGSLTMTAGPATWTYVVSLDVGGTTGRLAEAAGPANAGDLSASSGYMVRQDSNAFNLASLDGNRVIALYGEATGSHVAVLGRFTSTAGTLSSGNMDLSWELGANEGGAFNPVVPTGAFGAPDANTGRGTASLHLTGKGSATYHFAYYIVSDSQVLMVQTDARGFTGGLLIPILSGEVRNQNNSGPFVNASFNAPVVFHLTDSTDDWSGSGFPMIRIGQMAPNGSGLLNITFDQNVGGRDPEIIGYQSGRGKITLNGTTSGTYSVSANGRVTWSNPSLYLPFGSEAAVAYLTDQNKGYFMTADLDGAAFGEFEPQTAGPFSTQAIAGTYRLNTGPPATWGVENDAGWMTLGADGSGTATLYVNAGTGATPYTLTVTATMASNGRGTLLLNGRAPFGTRNLVFWAISPTRWVAISTVNDGDQYPALLFVERTDI